MHSSAATQISARLETPPTMPPINLSLRRSAFAEDDEDDEDAGIDVVVGTRVAEGDGRVHPSML